MSDTSQVFNVLNNGMNKNVTVEEVFRNHPMASSLKTGFQLHGDASEPIAAPPAPPREVTPEDAAVQQRLQEFLSAPATVSLAHLGVEGAPNIQTLTAAALLNPIYQGTHRDTGRVPKGIDLFRPACQIQPGPGLNMVTASVSVRSSARYYPKQF